MRDTIWMDGREIEVETETGSKSEIWMWVEASNGELNAVKMDKTNAQSLIDSLTKAIKEL